MELTIVSGVGGGGCQTNEYQLTMHIDRKSIINVKLCILNMGWFILRGVVWRIQFQASLLMFRISVSGISGKT